MTEDAENMLDSLYKDNVKGFWVISIATLMSFVGCLIACICSCRRNDKSEFLGLAGMVTIAHPDSEVYNGLPPNETSRIITRETTDSGKRASTANRSLPDIPKDKNVDAERGVEESMSQDAIYETGTLNDPLDLYATVDDKEQGSGRDKQLSEQSSQDETINPYASLSAPRDTEEHPYAQVQAKGEGNFHARNSVGQSLDNNEPSTSSSQATGNPIAPPRTRRSSSHNQVLSTETLSDIQAANAISGGVQANQDLPYMTPPLLMLLPHPPQSQRNIHQPEHFSGDSQDSKGYTSISVREPLADIIAQTKGANQHREPARLLTDSHYATVSDDSDEMYAAIDEQDKVYTSGSETYAQIQPMTNDMNRSVISEQNSTPVSQEHTSAPQPPSVDSLRHVAHAHSRQDDNSFAASSSSATSSIVIPSSPKPEKRQANSPLPPPPPPAENFAELYALIDKRSKAEDRLKSGKSLDEMYAKVIKKKKDNDESYPESAGSYAGTVFNFDLPTRKLSIAENNHCSTTLNYELPEVHKREPEHSHEASPGISNRPTQGYDVGPDRNVATKPITEHNYAVATDKRNVVSPQSPSYEYEPTYETLPHSKKDQQHALMRNGIDSSVVYSVPFKNRQASNASSDDSGYEKVKEKSKLELDAESEPNYESMPHDAEPSYASVDRPGDSDTDPNYESVMHNDPNYESVKYMSMPQKEEPPYEQVTNCKSSGYEKIKHKSRKDPDYEKIDPNYSTVDEVSANGDADDSQCVKV